MAQAIGTGVGIVGIPHDEWHYTVTLTAGVVVADIGKAMTWDAAGPNQMDLAVDDGRIDAILITVEDRTQTEGLLVGTVALKGAFRLTFLNADAVAVGDQIVAAPAGEVKELAVPVPGHRTIVTAVYAGDLLDCILF